MIRWLLIFCLTAQVINQSKPYVLTQLTSNWTMKIIDGPQNFKPFKQKIYNTSIPTTLHLDLLAAKDILDPFLKQNYPSVKWVSDCTVKYSLTFKLDEKVFQQTLQQLVFEGIDTYADVFLNKNKILSTQNAFRKYTANVKPFLKNGDNQLQVIINSTNPIDEKKQKLDNMPFAYAQTRKACYQYSWDWAPYMNTIGIWKKVYLQSFQQIILDYVWVRTRSITKDKAIINFAMALELWPEQTLKSTYQYKISLGNKQVAWIPIKEKYTYHDLPIQNPKLWWPNGIGKPEIYEFTVKLIRNNPDSKVNQKVIPFGIRTVQIDRSNKKFEVKVNGYSIYCKGANYVPPDMFYPRLQNSAYQPATTIEDLLNAAVDSNFNMIRIWGGGQYESEKFLELASRKGIMLFYDFMFSDSVYPSSKEFLLNVQQQIKEQIKRARNYPALTLWSGNNEILQGINDWGWSTDKAKEDYRKLFQVLIPKIIQYQSPYIPYIPSSPVYGVGNSNLERGGDVHYWGVWAAGSDFESYIENVGKFNSQFGTQSLPLWQTIIEALDSNPSYDSKAVIMHQRHNSQFGTFRRYIESYMKPSLNFEMETYQSGLLQAYAIEVAIKAQRMAKPNSFGTLYWQLNDAWPGISWSSIDYYGRWKPLQFMAKRLFSDVAIFTQNNKIAVVNDKLVQVNAYAVIQFFTFDGKQVNKIQKKITLQPNEVQIIHNITDEDYKGENKKQVVVYTQVTIGKQEVMSSTHFNVKFKDLNLPQANITVEFHSDINQMIISTKGPVVKNLYISHNKIYLKATNNYFDLVPGHPVKIVVYYPDGLKKLKEGLKFRSYREVYTKDGSVAVDKK